MSWQLHQQLTVERIDSIKDDLQEALLEERQQLLEDIEFIQVSRWHGEVDQYAQLTPFAWVEQGCLEMEKDLIDEDRRTVAKPPPSLSELRALSKALEKTLDDQV
jgi:hypothetical protein